jgi:hypothetical protein
MDYFDLNINQDKLIQRAKQEAQDAALIRDLDMNDPDELERTLQKKMKKRGKMLVHQVGNKGNFSSFRNKSFIPNASKSLRNQSVILKNNGNSPDTKKDVDSEEEEEEEEEDSEEESMKERSRKSQFFCESDDDEKEFEEDNDEN